jgi:hypothetical protein
MRYDKKDLFGAIALPSLQRPGLYVTRPEDLSEPAGYGPIAPEWPTRAARLGPLANTFSPTRWYETPLPDDIDPSFFNVAPPDQRLREVRLDERLVLEGLTPDQGRFVTQLPALAPQAIVERAMGRRDPLSLRADTLWIDTSRRICTVTWRASVALTHASEGGRIIVTMGTPATEASRVFARHDPALLSMPMTSDDPDGGGTISINLHGKPRPVTPFDPGTITEPSTVDLFPDDPAFVEDDEITFVQSDDIKTSTLPFVATQNAAADRSKNVPPPPAFDMALPFASRPRAPSSPGLPFVAALAPPPLPPPVAPTSPSPRDLPFFTPHGPSNKSASGVFPQPSAPSSVFPPPVATSSVFPPPSAPPAVFPQPSAPSSVFPPPVAPSAVFPPPVAPSSVFPPPAPVKKAAIFGVVSAATSFPVLGKPPMAPPPPPPFSHDTTPEAPAMIGPLATPEMVARSTTPFVAEPVPAPPEPKAPPVVPAAETPLEEDDSIERCARITASIARRKDERANILETEKLEAERFAALQTQWNGAISAETNKGKTKLLEKFDEAYVGRLEEERGTILAEEFARLVVASERGHPESTLRELGLPQSALMRIERVFLRRTTRDLELSQKVLRAIDAERDA